MRLLERDINYGYTKYFVLMDGAEVWMTLKDNYLPIDSSLVKNSPKWVALRRFILTVL